MSINSMEDKLMLELNPNFQRLLFTVFIKEYGFKKCCSLINKSQGMIYHYRNNRVKLVPKSIVEKVCNLCNLNNELKINIVKEIYFSESVNQIMSIGRKINLDRLKMHKESIPNLEEVMHDNFLDLEKWFDKYKFLTGRVRKLDIKHKEEYILIRYSNFTKNGFKDFEIKIPKRFILNDEFVYFFGLWCGDRVGGRRFGICNQNQCINKFTKYFLKKNHQKVEKILYITKGETEPKIRYNKILNFITRTGKWSNSII